jgi:GH25 family lysozyme M1 (1,4-beta-N-acetylmuramidase)
MSPTILRVGPYRFFFFSREEPRAHVHVHSPDGEAKFWLEPVVELAVNHGLSDKSHAEARKLVEENQEAFRDAWKRHFGS